MKKVKKILQQKSPSEINKKSQNNENLSSITGEEISHQKQIPVEERNLDKFLAKFAEKEEKGQKISKQEYLELLEEIFQEYEEQYIDENLQEHYFDLIVQNQENQDKEENQENQQNQEKQENQEKEQISYQGLVFIIKQIIFNDQGENNLENRVSQFSDSQQYNIGTNNINDNNNNNNNKNDNKNDSENYNQEGDLVYNENENEEEFEYYDGDQNKINPFQVDQEIQEGIDFPVNLVNQESLEGFMAIMENLAELQMIFKSDFKEICSFYSLEELYKFIERDYDFSEEEEQQFKGEDEQKFAINRLFGYLDALENQLVREKDGENQQNQQQGLNQIQNQQSQIGSSQIENSQIQQQQFCPIQKSFQLKNELLEQYNEQIQEIIDQMNKVLGKKLESVGESEFLQNFAQIMLENLNQLDNVIVDLDRNLKGQKRDGKDLQMEMEYVKGQLHEAQKNLRRKDEIIEQVEKDYQRFQQQVLVKQEQLQNQQKINQDLMQQQMDQKQLNLEIQLKKQEIEAKNKEISEILREKEEIQQKYQRLQGGVKEIEGENMKLREKSERILKGMEELMGQKLGDDGLDNEEQIMEILKQQQEQQQQLQQLQVGENSSENSNLGQMKVFGGKEKIQEQIRLLLEDNRDFQRMLDQKKEENYALKQEMEENEGNYVRKIEFLEKQIAAYKEENQKVNDKLRELKELYEGEEGKKLGEEFFNSQLRQSEIQFENLNGLRKQSKENVQQEFQLANQINQSQIDEFGGGFEAKHLLENSRLSGVDKSSIDFGYNTEIQQLNLAQQSYINNNNQQNSGLDQLEIINNLEKQKQELLKSKEKKTSGQENEQGENDIQVQIVEDKEMNQNLQDQQENQQQNSMQNKREKSYSSSIIEDLSFLQRQQKKFSYQENQNQNQNQNQDNQKNTNFLNVPGQNQLNFKSEIRQVGSFDSGYNNHNNNKIYSVLNSNNKRKNSEQVKNLKKMNLDKRGLLRFQTVIEKKKSNKGGEIKPLDEDKLEKLQKIVQKQKTMQVNNRDLEQIFKEIKEEENQKKQLPKSKTVMFQTEIGFSSKQENNLFDKKTKSQLKSNPLSGKLGKINFQAESKEEKKQNLEKILKKQVKKYQYLDKKDYYYLKNNLGFQKLCYKLGTDYKPLFSDRGYVFDPYQKQTKKSECVILINSREIFFIHHKYLKLQEKLPRICMRTVAGVIFNDFCSSLTILKVIKSDSKNEFDYYFLENFKRYEMISFLATIYKKSQKMQLPIMQGKFEQVREILGKGHAKVRQNRGKILREQICANSCFNTSKNLGFLQLKQDSFFRSNKWVDVFVVLNEQGFVCYRCGENEQYIFPINSKSYLCKNLIIMKNCKAFSFLVSDDLKQKKQLYNVDLSQNNQKKQNLDFGTNSNKNENKNLGKIEENQEEEDESSGEDQSQNKNENENENENQSEKNGNCTLKTGDSNDLKGVIFSAYSQCNLDFVTRIIEKFLDSRMNLEQNLLNHEIKRISNVECNLNYV